MELATKHKMLDPNKASLKKKLKMNIPLLSISTSFQPACAPESWWKSFFSFS